MRNEKQLQACLDRLKNNTNKARNTLYNAGTLEVRVAMTLLKQKGNEDYLKLYTDWLDEKQLPVKSKEMKELIDDFVENS